MAHRRVTPPHDHLARWLAPGRAGPAEDTDVGLGRTVGRVGTQPGWGSGRGRRPRSWVPSGDGSREARVGRGAGRADRVGGTPASAAVAVQPAIRRRGPVCSARPALARATRRRRPPTPPPATTPTPRTKPAQRRSSRGVTTSAAVRAALPSEPGTRASSTSGTPSASQRHEQGGGARPGPQSLIGAHRRARERGAHHRRHDVAQPGEQQRPPRRRAPRTPRAAMMAV